MHVIKVRNVHAALPEGIRHLSQCGYERSSRNGPVLQAPTPVITSYRFPQERVLFYPLRDANPWFHFFESLWMLAGRNDVQFPSQFVSTFKDFSDDGKIFHGSYGFRWRQFWGKDQLSVVARRLRKDPTDRRVVISMWDVQADLDRNSKDLPCNTHIYPLINPSDGALDLTVCCRSNDMVWGAYGANAVHFSVLQEYLAFDIGVRVGRLHQLSNNYHAYRATFDPLISLGNNVGSGYFPSPNPYSDAEVKIFPLISTDIKTWMEDLSIFMVDGPITGFRDPFFRQVVTPLWYAFKAWKKPHQPISTRAQYALEVLEQCQASDWRRAAIEWIHRRIQKAAREMENGVSHEH